MGRIVRALTAMVALMAAPAGADAWTKYENDRFGTAVEVPAQMIAGPRPTNGDGQSWTSPDARTRVTAYGNFWGVTVESWDDYRVQMRRWMLEDKVILTYTPMGETWFVLSGKKGDEIVYVRVQRSARCQDIAHHLDIAYPAAQKEARDAWVARMSKSLGEVPAAQCP